MIQFEPRIEGFDAMTLGIRGIGEHLKKEIVEAISEASNAAEQEFDRLAPIGETGRLHFSIHNKGVSFHPGGLGGGGFWEAELSVGEGIDYLRFVVEGTGIHGAGRGNITPQSKSIMKWTNSTGIHWAKKTTGQPPQDKWIIAGQQKANEVIARKIKEIDALHQG